MAPVLQSTRHIQLLLLPKCLFTIGCCFGQWHPRINTDVNTVCPWGCAAELILRGSGLPEDWRGPIRLHTVFCVTRLQPKDHSRNCEVHLCKCTYACPQCVRRPCIHKGSDVNKQRNPAPIDWSLRRCGKVPLGDDNRDDCGPSPKEKRAWNEMKFKWTQMVDFTFSLLNPLKHSSCAVKEKVPKNWFS